MKMTHGLGFLPRHPGTHFGLALAVTLATLWIRADIAALFSNRPLLILLTLPIIFSAVIGGLGPGLVSTLIAALGSAYFFPPEKDIRIANLYDQIQWGFLLINGVVVSVLSELLHRTSRNAELNLRNEVDAITALRMSDHQLRFEHARLAAIVDSAADAIIGKNLDGVVTSWNPAAETIFGYPAEAALGRTLSSLIVPPGLQDEERAILARVARGELVHHLTTVRHRADGSLIDVAVNIWPIRAADGSIIGAAKTVRDITLEKRKNARFRLAADAAGIGVWVWHLNDDQLIWDDRMFEMYGVPTSLRSGGLDFDDWKSRVHPDDSGPAEVNLRQLVAGDGTFNRIYRIQRGDGETRWIKSAALVEHDPSGHPVQVVGTDLDITEETLAKNHIVELNATLEAQVTERTADLKAAIQTLNDQEKFIRTVTDALPVMLGYWDADLRLRFANATYRNWLGKADEEILGNRLQELVDEAFYRENENHIRAVLCGAEQNFERTMIQRDGTTRETLASYLPDIIDDQVRGFYVVVADVTRLKMAELRLAELNVELERRAATAEGATHAKSEFLANMSHEIRTPMNGILGLCYLMEKQDLPPAARETLRRISSAGHALLSIINDILDFSKIEARQLTLEQVPFRLSDVLDQLASTLSAAVGSKPVEFIIGPAPAGADFLTGDPLRLGQVLINLVGNAIKFTDQGEVVMRVERLENTTAFDRASLRFSVCDTGIGIAGDKQNVIFGAFSQADASTTRSFGGTGLGLTISKSLVELMGGSLRVNSEPGTGSEFSFELAFVLSDPGANVLPEMTHQRVLIADDHDTARAVLGQTVTSLGWHAEVVASGEQAVDCVHQDSGPGYDILLLDWRMPGLDGVQTAARIRSGLIHAKDPIIIMVTAYDREQLQQQDGSEVVDAILTKPVTSSSLYYAVMQAKNHRGQLTLPSSVPTTAMQLTGVKVLVVDDSDLNRDVAASILRGEGATVELAEDGSAALTALNCQPDYFDVVLMDIQMPVMDGYSATRQIRSLAHLAHLPVVALSAGAFSEQRELALAAGVDEFVAKPFDVNQLVATVARLARLSGSANPAATSIRLPQKMPLTADRPAGCLDLERGLQIWKNSETYLRYLRKFTNEMAQLQAQIAVAEAGERRRLAHKLKGAAGNLGLLQVAASAGQLDLPEEQLLDPADTITRLREALINAQAAIASLDTASDEEKSGPPMQLIDHPAALRPLVENALRALTEANPDAAEPFIAALAQSLSSQQLKPLRDALENFASSVESMGKIWLWKFPKCMI